MGPHQGSDASNSRRYADDVVCPKAIRRRMLAPMLVLALLGTACGSNKHENTTASAPMTTTVVETTTTTQPPLEQALLGVPGYTYGEAAADLVASLDQASQRTPLASRWVTRGVSKDGVPIAAITLVEPSTVDRWNKETGHVILDGWAQATRDGGGDPHRKVIGPEQVLVTYSRANPRQQGWYHEGIATAVTDVASGTMAQVDAFVAAYIDAQHQGIAEPTDHDILALEGELSARLVPIDPYVYANAPNGLVFDSYQDTFESDPPKTTDFHGIEHYSLHEIAGASVGPVVELSMSLAADPIEFDHLADAQFYADVAKELGGTVSMIGDQRVVRTRTEVMFGHKGVIYSFYAYPGNDMIPDSVILTFINGQPA